ncbi:tetratricopeptide repeat protein [Mesonia phycicola]|nr:hypothetical protein [Mesonia phycicola]
MMKLKIFVTIVVFFLSLKSSFAQYKQMLNQPYQYRVEAIDEMYRNTINNSKIDSSYISMYCNEIKDYAFRNDNIELALEADLLKAYSFWFIYGKTQPDCIENFFSVIQKSKKHKVAHIEIRAQKVIATHYWQYKNYEKAFEWLLYLSKSLAKFSEQDFPNMAEYYNFIARCYYSFKDYNQALYYYCKSSELKKTKFNFSEVIEAQNTIGLCYQKLNQLKLAEQEFLKVINDSSQFKSDIWKGIATGNLGFNYYLQNKYHKAIPLFNKDIHNALQIGDFGLAAGSAIPLADIYLKQNKLQQSKQKIDKARFFIKITNQNDRLVNLYPIISKWYAANNEPAISSLYIDSTVNALNNYNGKYSALQLLKANQKVEAIDRELALEKLHTKSRLRIYTRNIIIIVISLLLLFSLLVYWFRGRYLVSQQKIKELKIEKSERELIQAKNQLHQLTSRVQNEQKIIESLQKELQTNSNQKLISKLKSKIIITNEDWSKYQNLFEEVYPNFLRILKNNYEQLTPSEVRCLCLEKLELSNNEMGLILGISANSIMVTKHRIRKKLKISNQKDLKLLIKSIG